MRFSAKFSRWLALLSLLLCCVGSWAEGIAVREAHVFAADDGYFVNAEFGLELTPALEEALSRGISLTFQVSLDVIEPRWYWFNKDVVTLRQERRLSFNPLTRAYRFSIGSLYLSFNSLQDALQSLAQLNRIRLGGPGLLRKGERYEAHLQMKLDVAQLPKPFQVDALSSNEWNLTSRPLTWKITP
ncbi:MAG: DUF4390 domain-containing protein [Betaproteobacteria bacterium]|nr:DUF4390 domain-containing protein [Betaproteobacteria bacterium]MDE2623047.1 DUF4390 domain-containing protein [Betaproteobacteria bacterium]